MKYGSDVLARRPIPTLAMFGTLDSSRAVDSAAAMTLARTPGGRSIEVALVADVGHQFGPQVDGRIGPVAPEVLERVAAWAVERTGR